MIFGNLVHQYYVYDCMLFCLCQMIIVIFLSKDIQAFKQPYTSISKITLDSKLKFSELSRLIIYLKIIAE